MAQGSGEPSCTDIPGRLLVSGWDDIALSRFSVRSITTVSPYESAISQQGCGGRCGRTREVRERGPGRGDERVARHDVRPAERYLLDISRVA